MTLKKIETLLEKLSCDFILADPDEPESLSGLLPILKQVHSQFRDLSQNDNGTQVLKARKIIDLILKNNSSGVDKNMEQLGEIISGLSSSINLLETSDHPEPIEDKSGDIEPDNTGLTQVEESLDRLSILIGGFCPGEIPDIGAMLNSFDELIDISKKEDFTIFYEISIACKGYVENMTLENIYNTKPIEEGLVLLKSIMSHLKRDKVFGFDYSDVL